MQKKATSHVTKTRTMPRASYNGKWKCVSPENVVALHKYTFNFNPEMQPKRNGYSEEVDSFKKFNDKMRETLGTLKYALVDVCLEISQTGRLHYHGYIVIEQIIEFFFYDIPLLQSLGAYEIDTIADEVKWEAYVIKLRLLMKPFCEKKHLTFNINTIMNKRYVKAPVIEQISYDDNYNTFEENDEFGL